jgi:plastocyanin
MHMKFGYHSSLLMIIFVAVGLTLAGCSSSSGTETNNNNDDPPTNGGGGASGQEVEMVGQSFSPGNIEVEVGTTVTWVNSSSLVHTVTSGSNGESDGTFNSGNVAPGDEFSYTFSEVGEFDYFCIPHVNSGMVGSVNVVDSGDDS